MYEAARVDDATDWQVFTKIILPLSRPMLAGMFLFAFIGIYQEFVMSSAILRNPNNFMLAQGLRTFINNNFSTNWGKFTAAVVVSSVPLAVIWGFAQKYVESGLTKGAIKGKDPENMTGHTSCGVWPVRVPDQGTIQAFFRSIQGASGRERTP